VSLFNVHDAESIDWSLELAIPILWTELTPQVALSARLALLAGDSFDREDPFGLRVTADGGLTVLDTLGTFERYWNGPDAARAVGVQHRVGHDQPVQAVVTDASGNRAYRAAHDFGLTYVVETKTWLGRFQPSECRGLVDYLDEQAFITSYLPTDQIPIQRADDWQPVEDPRLLGPAPRGTVVVAVAPVVVSDGRFEPFSVEPVSPLPGQS
jgi:hypothetical protein